MADVRAIVLRAAGINCDLETQNALELAGAQADRVHINRIIEDFIGQEKIFLLVPPLLNNTEIVVIVEMLKFF